MRKVILVLWTFFVLIQASCSAGPNSGNIPKPPLYTISSITNILDLNTGDAGVAVCEGDILYTLGMNSAPSNFKIFDLTDITNPLLLSSLDAGWGSGMVKYSNYLYIHTAGNGTGYFTNQSLVVLDVSDITNPSVVSTNGQGSSYPPYQIYLQNGYLFTLSDSIVGVFDVTTPGILNRITNVAGFQANWGAISENYLYLQDYKKLRILNISNPWHITETFTSTNRDDFLSGGIALAGNYLYLANYYGNLVIADVSHPAAPVFVTNFYLGSDYCRDMKILGNYLLIAGQYAFYVVDISSPLTPILVDSVPLPHNAGWGLALLRNRYAIVADDTVYHVIRLY